MFDYVIFMKLILFKLIFVLIDYVNYGYVELCEIKLFMCL